MDRLKLPVRVNNPKRLPGWNLPAGRIPIAPGYKPSMALLPDGTLVMVSLSMEGSVDEGTYIERTPIWYSKDGGETWTNPRIIEDMIGREQWLTCTGDGTLFATCHLLTTDQNNEDNHATAWLHRSTDAGATWERTRATIDGEKRCGVPAELGSNVSRNVVELPDRTLLFGVGIGGGYTVNYMWKSADGGKSWDKNRRIKVLGYYNNWDPFFAEDFTYLNDSGKLFHWCRVGHPSPMANMADGRHEPTGNDNCDRMMWTESEDQGLTWSNVTDFGDYGQMYPRVIKLHDGRLLMTYTQRDVIYPIGLRARFSYDDGETWDFENDQIVVESFTPWGFGSGGGFGNTIQLSDNNLVSCYSYKDGNEERQIEVVRWNLP